MVYDSKKKKEKEKVCALLVWILFGTDLELLKMFHEIKLVEQLWICFCCTRLFHFFH